MVSFMLIAPSEMLQKVAERAKSRRLMQNLTQQTLAVRSGVSYGALKKFERTGQISFESLLKLAVCLGSLGDFECLFSPPKFSQTTTLDQLMQDAPVRKRGRK